MSPADTRAVVTAPPGEPVTVTVYAGAERVAVVPLTGAQCLALAERLISAARSRLAEENAP
ncbi:MAG: hypothetical protein H7840_15465 [Alphaproteobacteria bacterium]